MSRFAMLLLVRRSHGGRLLYGVSDHSEIQWIVLRHSELSFDVLIIVEVGGRGRELAFALRLFLELGFEGCCDGE